MKYKVALCIRGAVSKIKKGMFTNPSDLYNIGEYVNYKACYISILRHIIEYNKEFYDFDVFLQGWNLDLQDDLCKLYKPKKYLFENNDLYKNEILNKINKTSDFGQCSQSLAIKKSIGLMKEYEKENNITYDVVILYRPDILLWKDMNLKNLLIDSETVYVNAYRNCNGDFHFIMNSHCAEQVVNMYDSIKKGNEPMVHNWIKKYLTKYINKKLLIDNIVPGKDQEVLRKIMDFSISKGYLSINKLYEYGMTKEEILKY